MSPVLVRGGTLVTGDGRAVRRDLRLHGAPSRAGSEPVMSAEERLVLPGMVNGHDHLRSMVPFTRRADTSPLSDLIHAGQLAAVAATPQDYRALTALASARQALSGVVAAVDHVYPIHREGMLRAVVDGHADIGLRAHVAYGLISTGDPRVVDDLEKQLQRAVAAADDVLPAERLYLAPVSLRQTSIDGYRATVATADRTGLRLYTHVAETREEVQRCQAEHGQRPVELLNSLGFLRPGTMLVHCVHVTAHEIELLARNRVAVAYCPSNHLKFAKGFAPVLAMREAGVRVCLGIDGMTDMFTEMRQAVYAQSSAAGRPGALTTQAAWQMATTDGYAALGEPNSGRLTPEDPADLLTVPTDDAMLAPLVDPVQALVHRGSSRAVCDVLVAGDQVVRDGRLVKADLGDLVARALEATRGVARRSGREVSTDWTWRR